MQSYFCEFCGKYADKRKAAGIGGFKGCGKVKAGGAYTLKIPEEPIWGTWDATFKLQSRVLHIDGLKLLFRATRA